MRLARYRRNECHGHEARIQFWTDTRHMKDVVEEAVDPTTALGVGLTVDADVLPKGLLEKVDL